MVNHQIGHHGLVTVGVLRGTHLRFLQVIVWLKLWGFLLFLFLFLGLRERWRLLLDSLLLLGWGSGLLSCFFRILDRSGRCLLVFELGSFLLLLFFACGG